ncbi:hypothetical protein [Amycolatopsis sp. NPDC059657]|uniref:hypothetical protein n=1 Tax=Amycolatopsis sp. NPDC059657 TaxID=3346899 RepID=UPI00366DA857
MMIGGWALLAVFVLAAWTRITADKTWRTWALLLTLGFSLLHQLLYSTVTDDAFTTFRYARNIAEGYGPVFNPGDHVEGYPAFLWLVLVSMPKVLFGWDIVVTAVVLGIIAALASVLLAYFVVSRIVGDARQANDDSPKALGVLAAVLTAAAGGLAAYGGSGLETSLYVFILMAVVYALAAHRPVIAGVLATLATMTRPEGVLVVFVAGLWLLYSAVRKRTSWWAPAGYVLGALVFAVPRAAWRETFYGHLLPNVVAAKLGGPLGWRLETGFRYLSGFSLAHLGFLLLGVATLGMLLRNRAAGPHEARGRSLVWLVLALVVAQLVVVLLTSGADTSPAWRLFVPIPPMLAIAACAAFGVVTPARPVRGVPIVALVLAGAAVVASALSPHMLTAMHDWRTQTAEREQLGDWLGDRLAPGTVIAVYSSGAVAYHAGTSILVIDVLGVTDDHIARHGTRTEASRYLPTDFEYVLNRRPALALATAEAYTDSQHCVMDPSYAPQYGVATFKRLDTGKWVTLYLRGDQYQTLNAQLSADDRYEFVPCP